MHICKLQAGRDICSKKTGIMLANTRPRITRTFLLFCEGLQERAFWKQRKLKERKIILKITQMGTHYFP